jgi:hypothetical protein
MRHTVREREREKDFLADHFKEKNKTGKEGFKLD